MIRVGREDPGGRPQTTKGVGVAVGVGLGVMVAVAVTVGVAVIVGVSEGVGVAVGGIMIHSSGLQEVRARRAARSATVAFFTSEMSLREEWCILD